MFVSLIVTSEVILSRFPWHCLFLGCKRKVMGIQDYWDSRGIAYLPCVLFSHSEQGTQDQDQAPRTLNSELCTRHPELRTLNSQQGTPNYALRTLSSVIGTQNSEL